MAPNQGGYDMTGRVVHNEFMQRRANQLLALAEHMPEGSRRRERYEEQGNRLLAAVPVVVRKLESRRDKFHRLAPTRFSKVIERYRLLGNLADNRYYDYTGEEALTLVMRLDWERDEFVASLCSGRRVWGNNIFTDIPKERSTQYNSIAQAVDDRRQRDLLADLRDVL